MATISSWWKLWHLAPLGWRPRSRSHCAASPSEWPTFQSTLLRLSLLIAPTRWGVTSMPSWTAVPPMTMKVSLILSCESLQWIMDQISPPMIYWERKPPCRGRDHILNIQMFSSPTNTHGCKRLLYERPAPRQLHLQGLGSRCPRGPFPPGQVTCGQGPRLLTTCSELAHFVTWQRGGWEPKCGKGMFCLILWVWTIFSIALHS